MVSSAAAADFIEMKWMRHVMISLEIERRKMAAGASASAVLSGSRLQGAISSWRRQRRRGSASSVTAPKTSMTRIRHLDDRIEIFLNLNAVKEVGDGLCPPARRRADSLRPSRSLVAWWASFWNRINGRSLIFINGFSCRAALHRKMRRNRRSMVRNVK